MLKILMCLFVGSMAFTASAFADTEAECVAKTHNPTFWRQTIRDCTRPEVSLFTNSNAPSKQSIVDGIVADLMSDNNRPGGPQLPPTPISMKPRSVIIDDGTYAFVLEWKDQYFAPCSVGSAFKHELNYTATLRNGDSVAGTATVFRRKDGSVACVQTNWVNTGHPFIIQ